ncbi:biosynthetic peptidoglycan transglycosylase [Ralstonia nicotianae]
MENNERLLPFFDCEFQGAKERAIFRDRFIQLQLRAVERRLGSASHRWCTLHYKHGTWLLWLIFFSLSKTLYRNDTKQLHRRVLSISSTIKLDDIDEKMLAAVIVAEDHRFLMHKGVDHVAFLRATASCLRGRRQGGSTIEQQLVRVISGDYRLTLWRKIKEMALAVRVCDILSKENLLRLYLEIAYFGSDADGVKALTKRLGFEINSISLEQAAQIAACLKYPLGKNEEAHAATRRARRVKHIIARLNALGAVGEAMAA